MILDKNKCTRCAIFMFYDPQGKVDDYISYMLDDMKKNTALLLVMCNGYVDAEGMEKLRAHSDIVLSRTNTGFDLGAYREALFYIGWKKLAMFDELVLFNYTFFGPLYPFSEMFDEMAGRDLDFWGITRHFKVDPDPFHLLPDGYLPEHIQSHFIVVRNRMLISFDYRDYIFNTRNPRSYEESIVGYEAVFTEHFEKLGYKWDTYIDFSKYEGYFFNPHMFFTRELLEEQRCPIIKRRSFFTDYKDILLNSCGEPAAEMYYWLCENKKDYLDMIWDNILRLQKMEDSHRILGLNYIAEDYGGVEKEGRKYVIGIIVESLFMLPMLEEQLKALPASAKIIVYAAEEDAQAVLPLLPEQARVVTDPIPSYMGGIAAIRRSLKGSEAQYVGIARLAGAGDKKPYSNYHSVTYSDWENLYYNNSVIQNHLDDFDSNPRMGLMIPPVPDFGIWFQEQRGFEPVGGSFWMRRDIFDRLEIPGEGDEKEWLSSLVEKVQSFLAYTGVGYSEKYASLRLMNQEYMLRENNKAIFSRSAPGYHNEMIDRIEVLANE